VPALPISVRSSRCRSPFPEVSYTETLAGAIYTESPDSSRFVHAYDGHMALTLGSAESAEMIAAIAEESH
jgi:hypothetical protein